MCIKLMSSTFKWFCLLCCACNSNYDQCRMMKSYVDHSNENHWAALFLAVLFISLYKVVLTFEFVWEILKCDHSNERFGLFPLSNLLSLFRVRELDETSDSVFSGLSQRYVLRTDHFFPFQSRVEHGTERERSDCMNWGGVYLIAMRFSFWDKKWKLYTSFTQTVFMVMCMHKTEWLKLKKTWTKSYAAFT